MNYVYHMDEGVLTLPEGFTDATVHAFTWATSHGGISLAVQREAAKSGRTFEQTVLEVTKPYATQLAAYAEEEPMEITLDRPAVSKRFRWHHESGVVYHHQVFVDLEGSVLLFTCAGEAAARDRVDDILHEALSGLRLREGG